MLNEPDPDPGGGSKSPKGALSHQEVAELKDQNEQQLLLINQLKEMLRKDQSTVSQEKVEEYVNTLSKARAKKSRQKKDDSGTSKSDKIVTANIDFNKKERINLLRQQMEENKARLAERGKSQKGIEKMVNEMQAQFKDSQQFNSPFNISLSEAKTIEYNENSSQKELYNVLITKERKISELMARSQKLENSVLDLQENVKEKDSVIDARTKAITLMTESLSRKGKTTLDALEETKEQMRRMQENFVALEAEMKARQLALLNDLKSKNIEISDLQEMNEKLRNNRQEFIDGSNSSGDLSESKKHNEELLSRIDELEDELKRLKSDEDGDLRKKLEESQKQNRELLEKIARLEQDHEQHLLDDLEVKNRLEGSYKEIADILFSVQTELEETKLKLKNYEDGAHTNTSKREVEEFKEENEKLQKQLQEALANLNLLKTTGIISKQKEEEESLDIEKLKKQLDESNKSMIKMRAQQKGKIKELNKKLEQFKKMNDANTLITQLQNENSKLSEKVAELEEEKGNMQLKMVESFGNSKDSSECQEQIEKMEKTVSRLQSEIIDKDKVVEILESELLSIKQQLSQKDEEFTTQISSEISSIHYEEQIEKLEIEKQQLKSELKSLEEERDELLNTVEILKKEKHDINTKLDSYIQENMELIDKLEKLSAEKVSSAESIEIVEGLTQQEKIELAAYQKIIGQEEASKCADDDNMDQPGELNESVLQLSEDTAELLQKIEMFTRERKEVMQKMDSLKEENNSLHVKVKEIENNRDILAETYEQLQNEKDALLNEKEDLIAKLNSVCDNTPPTDSSDVLSVKLKELQFQYEELMEENCQLKSSIKDLDSKMQEKFNLEDELKASKRLNDELDNKLKEHIEEIKNYENIIEDNKTQLIHSSQFIADLQNKLQDREKDIEDLNVSINDLHLVIIELQNKTSSYELMQSELKQLKSGLSSQLDQAQEYETELNRNSEVIKRLNDQLAETNKRILENNNELDIKNFEIEKLQKDVQNKEEVIKNLQSAIEDKDESFKKLTDEIKSKYLGLQQQLDSNTDTLQRQVEDLQHKNKEQLDKMKKLAANLKKKTQSYQELEKRYNEDKEKWESERTEKQATYHKKVEDLVNDCQQKDDEIQSLIDQIQHLQQTNADQQTYILSLNENAQKLNKDSLQKEMADSLHEEIHNRHASRQLISEEKVRELEMLLETRESELQRHAERIEQLQESLSKLHEEKSVLVARNSELEEKLNLTSNSFKEKSLLEDRLELKLAEVTANDEVHGKKLQEIIKERDELQEQHTASEELIKKLKIKLKKSHDKVNELKVDQSMLEELETVNSELKKHVATLEANCKHLQVENDSLKQRNNSDYEKMEADYQIQLEELLRAKNDLTVHCEKLEENIKEFESKEEEFLMAIEEYKSRLQDTNANTGEVTRLNIELHEALSKIAQLSDEISTLMDEINVLKTAKNSMEVIVQEAVDKIVQKVDFCSQTEIHNADDSATIQWPSETSDFDNDAPNSSTEMRVNALQDYFADSRHSEIFEPFVQAEHGTNLNQINTETTPTVDNSKEALMKKIKALEFLLFNVDKENVALTQCAEMVTELADMIYEKANLPQPPSNTNLESQIIAQSNSANEKQLEAEIMSLEQVDAAASNKQESQTIEYQKVDESLGEQRHAVIEPVSKPQKAYLCYTKDEKQHSLEAFEENDDGWGWGHEEGRLEEEHFTNVEHLPQVRNMQVEMNNLRDDLKVLQLEREKHLEEIKQLQIKSGKLVKKCKELKLKCEQSGSTVKPEDGGFFDLNETIQDELKRQVENLEKKLKEIGLDLEKERTEKKNLLKKVDVLASANDRMVEMKEIQDAEVHRWQRKYQEVREKMEKFEWDNDEFESKKPPSSGASETALDDIKVQELEQIIRDLTLDNEELQSLLEEQRNLRLEAEKKKDAVDLDAETREEMSQELDRIHVEKENLQQDILKLQRNVQEKDEIILQLQENNQIIEASNDPSIVAEVQFEQIALQNQIESLNKQLTEKEDFIHQLSNKFDQTTHSKIELENEIERLSEELAVKSKLIRDENTRANEKSQLLDELKSLKIILEEKEDKISQLNQLIVELRNEQMSWESTENQLKNMISQKDKNIDELLAEKQQKELDSQRLHAEENTSLVEELRKKEEELEQMMSQVTEKQYLVEDLKNKENEIELLTHQLSDKDREFEMKVDELEQAKNESMAMVNELNASWQIQVDRRGAEVAELWKNHLESVQNDFASAQKKLAFDVSELEERCNVLVNENNELRKNVDAEIRNEVDKLSALHQQIANNQHVIASLRITVQEKQNEIEGLQNTAATFEHELQRLKCELVERDKKISGMDVIVGTTQKQFDEERQVVEEIVKVLEMNLSAPLSYEKRDIVNEFNKQLKSVQDKDAEISQLKESVEKLEITITDVSGRSDREITGLNQIIEDLEKDLSVIHEKEAEIARLTSTVDQLILEKDSLSQELKKLENEHSNCQTSISSNVERLNQLQATCDSLEQKLKEKENTIEELDAKISTNDSNETIQSLSSELQQTKLENACLHQQLTEYQNQIQDLNQNLTHKIQDYDSVAQQLDYYRQTIAVKDEEINRLQTSLYDKETALINIQQAQYGEVEHYYQQQLSSKDYDNQTLQSQIFEIEKAHQETSAKLAEETKLREQFEANMMEKGKLIDEDTKQMEELKLIIEDQVVKIEELKKELFEKSSRYDGLIAEMDMERPVPVTHQPVSSAQVSNTGHAQTYTEDDMSEPASRAELDLALYMLHQRDVRCEELTVELTQLLEERDTLQLRLSNAIREKEEIRSRQNLDSVQSDTAEPGPAFTTEALDSVTEVAEKSIKHGSTLATKLSELKTVGYQKDKTLVDEQDARRLQQMSIMQQHIMEASKLPPEAAAKLVNANYTLSRDVQSPSKVLLNWLWGNSTPKAGNES